MKMITINANNSNNSNNSKDIDEFKKTIRDFLQLMIDYNEKEYDGLDIFIKNLCDDLYLILRNFGTEKQMLTCLSRERSQGRQQSYNPSQFDAEDGGELEDIKFEVSRDITNETYTSPQCIKLMRAVSGKI